MKKAISLCLAMLLLIGMLPMGAIPASADEVESTRYTRDEIVAITCAAFPEYATSFTSQSVPEAMTCTEDDPVVISETREVSDNEMVTYVQYASGVALSLLTKYWKVTNSSTSGNVTTYTGTLDVVCTTSTKVFRVVNFRYKINTSGYDSIVNSFSNTGTTATYKLAYKNLTETSSSKAYVWYEVKFEPEDYAAYTTYAARIILYVGNDTLTISAN